MREENSDCACRSKIEFLTRPTISSATLERGGRLGGAGCTLVKILKPGQDTRLDMPSLGIETVELLIKHNFACLAFEAGGTLFFDREKAVALAEKHGIAIVAVPEDASAFLAGNGR